MKLLALPAVLSALLLSGQGALAHSGHPHPRPQIRDAAGDALDKQGMHDIVGVTFEVTRSTKVVGGKRVASSTPKDFVVTLELAGEPTVYPGVTYYIGAGTPCGDFHIQTSFSGLRLETRTSAWFDECGPDSSRVRELPQNPHFLEPVVTVDKRKLIYTVPFRAMPKQIKVGTLFGAPYAFTAAEALGFDTVTFGDPATAIDHATGDWFRLS